jgi:hypothetical protein
MALPDLAVMATHSTGWTSLAIATAANLVAAAINLSVYLGTRRRVRRLRKRESRLEAGPVTAAVSSYARSVK